MAKMFISGTHGPDDSSRASMPFHIGKGAVEAGHEVAIALALDATLLLKDAVREAIVGVGMPPLKDLFQFAIEHGVRVYV